ncbi:RagB/SusD family nutrient uptake outer membrane protein [Larkinella humicola]|uniref:RagB/SusD family nutrient uptake outer membrane protein n=1 Tax=Larkinella humicola TaxID=2607654 RepID=A0A5N1JGS8_9BACT|nr:RagB/SusD family nutrient uptake outer membrane protein [Larkinella humicola]KAA9349830.1 RagB/SusD family nutrient uptake outer membrane protein [Larkinella humicola]
MKINQLYSGFLLALTLALSSCHDSLLNPTPESVLTSTNYYKTAKDMDLAVLGIYNRLQSRKPGDYLLMEVPGDNLYMSANTSVAGAPEIDLLALNSDNPIVADFWENTYNGIFRANSVLANIETPTDYRGTQKDQFIGEAKFMRALFYFDLVRIFGGVPKVTSLLSIDAASTLPRASEEEIYALIVDDLKDAIAKLPVQSAMARGRASKGAATGLLAKAYVYRKDWANAKTYLDQMATFNYSLLPNFASLWTLENEDNAEVLFAVKYIDGTNGQNLSTAFIPNAGAINIVNRGAEVALPSWSLMKNYVEGDTRYASTVTQFWVPPTKPTDPPIWYPFVSKYAVKHTFESSGLDLPVMRYADVLLLKAETLYELNQPEAALTELNKVRARAFGNTTHNYKLTDIASRDAFVDKLLLERQLEFAYENERWFDLTRTGKLTTVMTKEERLFNYSTKTPVTVQLNPKAYMKAFPVPQRQINQSAPGILTQNEGY